MQMSLLWMLPRNRQSVQLCLNCLHNWMLVYDQALQTWLSEGSLSGVNSVATAIADVFRKNGINVGRKFAEIMKILDKIDDVKSRGVI